VRQSPPALIVDIVRYLVIMDAVLPRDRIMFTMPNLQVKKILSVSSRFSRKGAPGDRSGRYHWVSCTELSRSSKPN
jgi:hypothetical protein